MTNSSLDAKIEDLRTTGSTALGPALAISAGIIANTPGSEVILCTDGQPNVGIGRIQGNYTGDFYTRVNLYSMLHSPYILVIKYFRFTVVKWGLILYCMTKF